MRMHLKATGRRPGGAWRGRTVPPVRRPVTTHLGGWTHDRRHHRPATRRRPAGGGRRRRRPRRGLPGVRRLGRVRRTTALPGAGRSAHRARVGRERRAQHPDRYRQVARRRRRALRGDGRGEAQLLHGTDQGARVREVLPARRPVRRAERRHGDGRLERQRRRPDHLLHRRDPREHRAPAGSGRRGRRRRHGRVPLLRRRRPRVGLAGAVARARAGAVPAHVRHPR